MGCPGGRWPGLESGIITLFEAMRTGESPQGHGESDRGLGAGQCWPLAEVGGVTGKRCLARGAKKGS